MGLFGSGLEGGGLAACGGVEKLVIPDSIIRLSKVRAADFSYREVLRTRAVDATRMGGRMIMRYFCRNIMSHLLASVLVRVWRMV